jgi:REP element-mobilizing transposase RayT
MVPCISVTICVEPRGRNQLCLPDAGPQLLASAVFYHDTSRWWLKILMLMPDHLHAVLAVPKGESLPTVVRVWKAYQTKRLSINWQSGFFDHRLRSDESEEEKTQYIRMNPVRAGLIAKPEDWPYVWPSG